MRIPTSLLPRPPSKAAVSFVCLAFSALAVATPSAVHAGDPPPAPVAAQDTSPDGYDQATKQALSEFELGNYLEARSAFLQAHKLLPSARTLRALGMVEYELRNYDAAVAYLESALASNVRPLEGTSRSETTSLLKQARGYVARVALELSPNDTVIVVDGVVREATSEQTLLLAVGSHVLQFRAPDHVAQTRHLNIKGGEEARLHVALLPSKTSDARQAEKRPLLRNPWLWTAVGVVVASVATGVGVAVAKRDPPTHEEPSYGGTASTVIKVP